MIIENSGRKIELSQITELEEELHIRLPDEYKKFLLNNNGGTPNPNMFRTTRKCTSRVKKFFSLGEDYEMHLKDVYYGIVGVFIPKKLFPMGIDPANNIICISLNKKDYGVIYFWAYMNEEVEYKPSYKNIHFVSDNFSCFINQLFDDGVSD